MTDSPINAADSPGVLPDKSFSPVAPVPTMSYAEAESRKTEYFGNQEWVNKYMSGDIEARQQYQAVVEALAYGKTPEAAAPDSVDGLVEWAGSIAGDLSDAVVQYHLRERGPVSPREVKLAQQRKAARMADPDYRQLYIDGNADVRQEMLLLNIILSSPVRDDPSNP